MRQAVLETAMSSIFFLRLHLQLQEPAMCQLPFFHLDYLLWLQATQRGQQIRDKSAHASGQQGRHAAQYALLQYKEGRKIYSSLAASKADRME